MKPLTMRRSAVTAMIAAGALTALITLPTSPAQASDMGRGKEKKSGIVDLQVLSFNDYHGHLESDSSSNGTVTTEDGEVDAGGAEYLTHTLRTLRKGEKNTLTVADGDQIGGSPSLSGLFKDEPSIETVNNMGVDVSTVGNHEFDEGITELLRMQYGGCHPTAGCFDDDGYDGANFPYLAANVVYNDDVEIPDPEGADDYGSWFGASTGRTVFPATAIRKVDGIRVGFIGIVTSDTPELVAPSGIADVTFRDEVESAALAAKDLQAQGVEAIVALVHEGGVTPDDAVYDYDCNSGDSADLSGAIVPIAEQLDPSIDLVVTGHTHYSYNCVIPDPDGNPRYVTSALSYGRVVTETHLPLSRKTKDVIRSKVTSENVIVDHDQKKAADQTAVVEKWEELAAPISDEVIGSISSDITRSESRDTESSLGDLIADAQLATTTAEEDGGAQIAFMNPGGVRANLTYAGSDVGEGDGNVTYGEAFTVQPFDNLLVSMDLTGEQIDTLLEEQWSTEDDDSTKFLFLGVSEGFAYSYSESADIGEKVDPDSITLNGETIDPDGTYRVTVNSFLADGGDGFTVLTEGTDRIGGGSDLDAFTSYLGENSPVTGPTPDRVTALD